jgi:hypothetical protein
MNGAAVVFAAVVTARLLVPLLIPRYPLFFVLLLSLLTLLDDRYRPAHQVRAHPEAGRRFYSR